MVSFVASFVLSFFTWLSLVVSFMASFVLSFFPLDVLDGIWDLIESVPEGFHTYSYFDSNIIGRILRRFFSTDYFEADVDRSTCLHATSSRPES